MSFRKKIISQLIKRLGAGNTNRDENHPQRVVEPDAHQRNAESRQYKPRNQTENRSHWVVTATRQEQKASIWQYKLSDQAENRLRWTTKSAAISNSQPFDNPTATAVPHSQWIDKSTAQAAFKRKLLNLTLSIIGIVILILAMKHFQKPTEVPTPTVSPNPLQQPQPPEPPQKISRYDNIIRTYADQYGFDWRLIAALMRQESNFNRYARSQSEARGLMQLMPETAKEVGVRHVYNPKQNIAGGVCYLRKMYDNFPKIKTDDRIKFALASYNGGLGHVLDAQQIAGYYKHSRHDWDLVKKALMKLTREHTQVHHNIWGAQEPRHGFFDGAQETVNHVEKVMNYYESYTSPESSPRS